MAGETWDVAIPLTGSGPWTLGPYSTAFEETWYSLSQAEGHYSFNGEGIDSTAWSIQIYEGDGSSDPSGNSKIFSTWQSGGGDYFEGGITYVRVNAGFIVPVSIDLVRQSHGNPGAPANDTAGGAESVDFTDGSVAFDNTGAHKDDGLQDYRDIYFKMTCPSTGYYGFFISGMPYWDIEVAGPDVTAIFTGDSFPTGGVLDGGVEYIVKLTQRFPTSDTSENDFHSGTMSWSLTNALPPNAWGGNGPEPARVDITQRYDVDLDISGAVADFNYIDLYYKLTALKAGILCITITPDDEFADWGVIVKNTTTGDRGDFFSYSYSLSGGARFGQVAVNLGDVVEIDLSIGTNLTGGQMKWGIAGYDELTWSDWFDSAYDDPFSDDPPPWAGGDSNVEALWGTRYGEYSGGGGWSVGRGPGSAWYSGGPYTAVGDALAYLQSTYDTIPESDPGDTSSPPDGSSGDGNGSQWGGGTWVLMGQAGGMDGGVHNELWRFEQARGIFYPNTGIGWTIQDLRFMPPMAYRADNGIDTKYGDSSFINPFRFNSGEKAYAQYTNEDGLVGDMHPWKTKMYVRAQWSWSMTLDLGLTAIVEFTDFPGDGAGPDFTVTEVKDEWPGGKGEQLLSLDVPVGSGSDTDPGPWTEYPNQGEMDAKENDWFGIDGTAVTRALVLVSYLDGVETEYSNEHTWASVGGPPTDYTGLYNGAWDAGGSSGAQGVVGYRYQDYRWGYLAEPNYDIIGGGDWARLRVWLPTFEWMIFGLLDENLDKRFYCQDPTTGDVWREFKNGDDVTGLDAKHVWVQSPTGPVQTFLVHKIT